MDPTSIGTVLSKDCASLIVAMVASLHGRHPGTRTCGSRISFNETRSRTSRTSSGTIAMTGAGSPSFRGKQIAELSDNRLHPWRITGVYRGVPVEADRRRRDGEDE